MGPLPTVADEPALTHTAAVPRGPLTRFPILPAFSSGHPLAIFFLIVPNLGPSVNEKARRRVRRAKEPDYLGWVSRWNFSR